MKNSVRRSNMMVTITAARPSPLPNRSLESEGPAVSHPPESPLGKGGQKRVGGGKDAWLHIPDAVTLDLEDSVPQARKMEARALVKEAIPLAGRGAAEVFVRINKPYLYADLEASVWPGITGIMLPKVGHADDVAQASELMEDMERRRGIEVGSLELIILLESALGVWNAREIITASPRATQVALGERDLCFDLGIAPFFHPEHLEWSSGRPGHPETQSAARGEKYDPSVYARGRMVIEGTAAGVQPVGIAYPLGSLPRTVPRDELLRLATEGRNLGFKGVICPHPSWVEPVNTAFTPTPELVEYYTQVREVFAQAIAAGTAAVPFAGRMLDVPVDEWAKVVLQSSASIKARDEEKRRALEGEG